MEQDPFPEFDWGDGSRLKKAARKMLEFVMNIAATKHKGGMDNITPEPTAEEKRLAEEESDFNPGHDGRNPYERPVE